MIRNDTLTNKRKFDNDTEENPSKRRITKSPSEVQASRIEIGNKAANLVFLAPLLETMSYTLKRKIQIPLFLPLKHQIIYQHLQTHLKKEYDTLWGQFKTTFKEQENHKILGIETKKTLKNLRESIISCFEQHPLTIENIIDFYQKLDPKDVLIVRSSGKEDSQDCANPGGNASIPFVKPQINTISRDIGQVCASYFSEKSLSQRIKANEDITEEPFLAVLLQQMICEQFNHDVIISGVIYTDEAFTRIQCAPGFGELIVNSKGNFDNFYVTQHNMIYAQVMHKDYRLAPKVDPNSNVITVDQLKNNKTLQNNQALANHIILDLHQIALFIQKAYDMRMDIEFVYEPIQDIIYIVQARPIVLGDKKMIPSSINPMKIADIKQSATKGKPITPEVNRSSVISSDKDMIICQNIEEALDRYLHDPNIQEPINSVIVEQDAPDTSHEAGEFSSKAISVFKVDKIDEIEALAEKLDNNQILVLDPQRKSLFQVNIPEDVKQPEAYLYEKEILKEGIYASTLSGYMLPNSYKFPQGTVEQIFIDDDVNIDSLGTLIKESEKGILGAESKLFSFIYHILNKAACKEDPTLSFNELVNKLENIQIIQFGKNNESIKQNLSAILWTIAKFFKGKLIESSVFKQIMFTGAEIYLLINQISFKEYDQHSLIAYLNVVEKLNGLITAAPIKGSFSNSVLQNLAENVAKKMAAKWVDMTHIPEASQEYFIQLMKMRKLLLTESQKDNWVQFCAQICQNQDELKSLISLVSKMVALEIESQWINLSFCKAYDDSKNASLALQKLNKEYQQAFKDRTSFDKIDMLLQEFENQIPLWKNPEFFQNQFALYKTKVNLLKTLLVYRNDDPVLKKNLMNKHMLSLIGILDRSSKAIEKSSLYLESEMQVNAFYQSIDLMLDLMETWGELAFNMKNEAFIREVYKNKINHVAKSELSPSGKFSVVGSCITVSTRLVYGQLDEKCTLEDLFSLIHQNLLIIVGILATKHSIPKEYYPSKLKMIIESIEQGLKRYSLSFQYLDFPYPELVLHYNIPLGLHSASLTIRYDVNTQKVKIKPTFWGGDQMGRWDTIEFESYYRCVCIHDIHFTKTPHYYDKKGYVEFEVEINTEEEINAIGTLLGECCAYTFGRSTLEYAARKEFKKIQTPRAQKLVNFFTKKAMHLDEWRKISIHRKILPFKFLSKHTLPDFNINQFLIEDYDIVTSYDFLFKEILLRYKDEIDWNVRFGTSQYSVAEHAIDHYVIPNFEDPTIDFSKQTYLIWKLFSNETGKEYTNLAIKAYQKGAPIVPRGSLEVGALNFFKEIQIDAKTLNLILFYQYNRGYPYEAFTDGLARLYSVDLNNISFLKSMLDIAQSEQKESIIVDLDLTILELSIQQNNQDEITRILQKYQYQNKNGKGFWRKFMDKVENNNDLFVEGCQLPILLAFHDNILENTKGGYGGNLKNSLSPLLNLLCNDTKSSKRLTQIISSENKDLIIILTQIKDHITKLQNPDDWCNSPYYNDQLDYSNYRLSKNYFIETLNSNVSLIIQDDDVMIIETDHEPTNLLTINFQNQEPQTSERSVSGDNILERPTKKKRLNKK